ncbi:hypothetical protein Agub_g7011 [Astrephomene gubernaculifera]|uniref:Clathrin light chain n=1 Tax=Astrephomene gubernaculifera TaxID=47775 RepID=A0AAD3DPL1_9CHLO|nr:hypothetical protein Agub_g7011 [Astrephomene gubernaculifera]
MDFGDSQFQGATPSGDDFNSFAAAVPAAPIAPETAPGENGSGLEDFFGGSGGAAPATSASVGLPLAPEGIFMEDPAPSYPDTDAPAAAAAAGNDEPFFQHYEPPAPPAPAPAPEVVDPRVEWRKQNAEVLKKKDAEEAAAKAKLKDAASQHLSKFYEVRGTTLTTRKANNRKSDAHQREVEVPASGSAWEKIHALVNLNSGNHSKDVARYKAVLIACKSRNLAVSA